MHMLFTFYENYTNFCSKLRKWVTRSVSCAIHVLVPIPVKLLKRAYSVCIVNC